MNSKLRQMLLGNKPGLIFLHIPKTGGSSIVRALSWHYVWSRARVGARASKFAAEHFFNETHFNNPCGGRSDECIQQFRIPLVHYFAHWGVRYISGHVWYHPSFERHRAAGYRFFTCLREPVSRFYSHYLWDRYKPAQHHKTELDFEAYLQSAQAQLIGTGYVRYLGGLRIDGDYTSASAIDQAVENIDRFDIVGHLEDLKGLKRQLHTQLGVRVEFGHQKRSPAAPIEARRIKESPTLRAEVERLCGPDLELYHRVRIEQR